ncbi:MAG: hypothetical protein KDE08_16670 [Rhodobacteraceae bacterium]|nr:hypothetical protein [Paracoccaceae bacterium]
MRRVILLLSLVFTAPAFGFTAQNGLMVAPAPSGFSVNWRGGRAGPTDFWCAAGDYAGRELGLSPTTVIYRASKPPRRAGEPMHFALTPAGAASRSGVLVLGHDDGGFSVGTAQSFCEFRIHRR